MWSRKARAIGRNTSARPPVPRTIGSGCVRIDGQTWNVKPGTFVKVPANSVHGLTNTGDKDPIFLVIYDPPRVATD
ncbi:cupin domain-containing protein [Mycobacterium sp. ACS1612]|uniref:cupin domain-containing protein n=1 Tax=Mycobacterium sp. ACS1612 TaxID=1834117 RepID=UPI0009EDC67D|nr:cupin domain-containing protein [Mycobacterium sp. ACS1612]